MKNILALIIFIDVFVNRSQNDDPNMRQWLRYIGSDAELTFRHKAIKQTYDDLPLFTHCLW